MGDVVGDAVGVGDPVGGADVVVGVGAGPAPMAHGVTPRLVVAVHVDAAGIDPVTDIPNVAEAPWPSFPFHVSLVTTT